MIERSLRDTTNNNSMQFCSFDPLKVLKDYETMKAGPWGR